MAPKPCSFASPLRLVFDTAALPDGTLMAAEAGAEVQRLQTEAEIKRLQERETLRDLGENANARTYIGFDKHITDDVGEPQAG